MKQYYETPSIDVMSMISEQFICVSAEGSFGPINEEDFNWEG